MEHKKRGMQLVVVLVFLIVSSTVAAGTTYQAFGIKGDMDSCSDDITEKRRGWYNYKSGIGCEDGPGWPSAYDFPSEGCYVFSVETDDCTTGNDDSYGTGVARSGTIIPYSGREIKLSTTGHRSLHDGNEYSNPLTCAYWDSGNDYDYLCADDSYWHKCDLPRETIDIVGSDEVIKTYVCLQIAGKYKWFDTSNLEGVDRDEDLVPDILDCAPDNGWVHGEFACRMEEASDKTCITDAECSDLVEGTCKPNGKCESKICETIAATEICGDGIDNDCSEWDGEEPYDYTNAEDDCDQDQTACESNCLASEETCSWIDSETGNNCCGDDGITDLGLIQDGTADGQPDSYLCLNRNEELVGSSAGLNPWPDQTDTSPESPNPQRCQGDWCWVKAGAEAKFKIFTIKKPDQQPYDIVSNSQEWFECSATTSNLASSVIDPDSKERANRFQCYQEGNRWSWAENPEKDL